MNNNNFNVPSLKDLVLEYFASISIDIKKFTDLVSDREDKELLLNIYSDFMKKYEKKKETDELLSEISVYLSKIGNSIDSEIKFMLLSEGAKIIGKKILTNIIVLSSLIDKYTRY